jgi:CHAD domain-containing protein
MTAEDGPASTKPVAADSVHAEPMAEEPIEAAPPIERAATPEPVIEAAPPRLALGEKPQPIQPGDSFAEAGRKAMWLHVDRLLAREAQLADPQQLDSLKRYRVATRRLRAALRVFREAFGNRAMRGIRRGLGDLADAVGEVRDLDVRIAGLRDWARTHDPDLSTDITPLSDAWAARRQAASESLLERLTTRRHARFREDLVEFVTGDRELPGDGAPTRTIRDRAGSETWAAYERVRAYTSIVRWADLPTLHQLRIEAKRLRYTIEFLGGLLGFEQARIVAQLVALQDQLGALNDAAIAAEATRAFLAERHATLQPEQRSAIEAYLADRERQVRLLRRGVARVWRPITSQAFARRLARAVAGPSPAARPSRSAGTARTPRAAAIAAVGLNAESTAGSETT